MKNLYTLLFTTAFASATAQNCFHVDYPGVMPTHSDGWQDASVRPGGVNYLEWALGMSVGRAGANGNSVLERHMVHMSPSVDLYPETVRPKQDGGEIVAGNFYPGIFEASCAVATNALGEYTWARIYMTDSTSLGRSSFFMCVNERSDGYFWATMACTGGIGLALLDATGAVVWHNRYTVSVGNPIGAYDVRTSVVGADNSITVVSNMYGLPNNARIAVVHVPADGQDPWAVSYNLGSVYVQQILQAGDGSYFLRGADAVLQKGSLLHLNIDGSFDWVKTYDPNSFTGMALLPSGNLLLSGTSELYEITPAGTPVNAWTNTIADNTSLALIGTRQDSIFVQHYEFDTVDAWSGLTVAASTNDLDCAFTPTTLPSASDASGPVITIDSLWVTPDQLKSWTMNIGTGPQFDEINIRAMGQSGPARPGFNNMIYLQALNMGGRSSGPLTRTLTFDPLLTYVDAEPAPASVIGNVITWLGPDSVDGFDLEYGWVRFVVPNEVALIGTTLTHTFTTTQDSVETDLTDNTVTITRTITGSYDPNDKEVLPRNFYHIENDSILDYTIQFQNTGNDTAFTVVVRDTLPLDVDTRTFEMGAASHPHTYSITGNGILTFTFANINLPDSNTNEPMSHGLVNFRIKPILPLTLGQVITNAADIYFDFNPPIHTPNATVVVTDETGVHPAVKPESLTVYPVPVRTALTALMPAGFKPVGAFAIGSDGRRVPLPQPMVLEKKAEYTVQHLPAGAYVLTLIDRSGRRMSARFTKE